MGNLKIGWLVAGVLLVAIFVVATLVNRVIDATSAPRAISCRAAAAWAIAGYFQFR